MFSLSLVVQVLDRIEDNKFLFVCGEYPHLHAGIFYKFQLRALSSAGEGPWSEVTHSTITKASLPTAPNPPRALKPNLTSILFSWSPPDDTGGSAVTGYRFNVQHTGFEIDLPRSQTTFLVEFLQPGKCFKVRVKAKNVVGESPYSNWSLLEYSKTSSDCPDQPMKPKPVAGSWSSISLEMSLPFGNGSSISLLEVSETFIFLGNITFLFIVTDRFNIAK